MSYVDVEMAHAPTDAHFRSSGLSAEVLRISAVRVRLRGKKEILEGYLIHMGFPKSLRICEEVPDMRSALQAITDLYECKAWPFPDPEEREAIQNAREALKEKQP